MARLDRLHDILRYLFRYLMRARPPAVLYRYRGTSYVLDGCLEDLLVHDRIKVPSPTRFNDPFDCRARLSFHGSAKDRQQFLAKQFAKHFGRSLSASELKESERTLRDPDARTDILAGFQVSIDNSAVLCLCDTATNPLLWAHYSSGHRGICLGFDTSAPPFSKAVRVKYQRAYPTANFMSDPTDQMKACILTKAAWWKYEQEWRVVTYGRPEGYWSIEADALKSVILGMKVEQHVADQVCRLCHIYKPQVQVLQAKAGPDTFDLQIVPSPRGKLMEKKQKTSVVLTPEAKDALAESLPVFVKDGRYLNCDSVNVQGYFVDLEVTTPHPHTNEEIPFRITLPAHFVLYMITAADEVKKELGFKE